MLPQFTTLGLLAALAIALPTTPTPTFSYRTSGAVALSASGHAAQFGRLPVTGVEGPLLAIDLSDSAGGAYLGLYTKGDRLPPAGRYQIRFSLEDSATGERGFHACFVAGTAEHPVGVFHAQSGWVTISDVEGGLVSGEFEIRARGFLAANVMDENQWVTLRGTFVARGDSTMVQVGRGAI